MTFTKRLTFSTVSRLPLDWLQKNSPVDVLIPYHHLVADEPVPYIKKLYDFKNCRQFEADLDFLLKHFEPVSLTDIINHFKQDIPFLKKSFLLTFDDGLRQVYENVAPILLRKGIAAALFVNPFFVDNKELFFDIKKGAILAKLDFALVKPSLFKEFSAVFSIKINSLEKLKAAVKSINYNTKSIADKAGELINLDFNEFKKEHQPFMSAAQIKILINQGFHVGAHSLGHPLYSLLSFEEQSRQTTESVNWVCSTFGLAYKAFAFPHVDTGVTNAFFDHQLTKTNPLDLILGNSAGMLEKRPGVLHRFIGENPAVSMEAMVKAVLAFSAVRKKLNNEYVRRK